MVNTVAVQEFLFSSFKRTLITVGVVLLVMFAVIVTASPVVRTTLLFLIYVAAGIWFGWRAVSASVEGKPSGDSS